MPVSPNVYIITETRPHESFDPLQADKSQNLAVMRMLYATPIEISARDELSSQILEHFHYDPKTRRVDWTVRDGLKYADGSPLTADDVAFAVARMLHSRPTFPVIRSIAGKDAWLSRKDPLRSLPSGLAVSGRKVWVTFDNPQAFPLFRFALELFSVIPKRCVDLATGKMTCTRPPESGPYTLDHTLATGGEAGLVFHRRANGPESQEIPATIRFEYRRPAEVAASFATLAPGTVVAGREDTYTSADLRRLKNLSSYRPLQKCRFADMDLNPTVPPFAERACRTVFAADFRAAAAQILAEENDVVEGSIFTKLMPGYLSFGELSAANATPSGAGADELTRCRTRLKAAVIKWAANDGPNNDVLVKALNRLGTPTFGYAHLERVVVSDADPSWKMFAEGRVAVTGGSSGFWALDPMGDLQMLFTPNLHEDLQFVARDKSLQHFIAAAIENDDSMTGTDRAQRVNQYVFDQALFNVYRHSRRFYAFPKGTDPELLQISMEAPYPWHVFAKH